MIPFSTGCKKSLFVEREAIRILDNAIEKWLLSCNHQPLPRNNTGSERVFSVQALTVVMFCDNLSDSKYTSSLGMEDIKGEVMEDGR